MLFGSKSEQTGNPNQTKETRNVFLVLQESPPLAFGKAGIGFFFRSGIRENEKIRSGIRENDFVRDS